MVQTWYHGSPLRLEVLRAGSTVTPLRHVAEVFSHKPSIVLAEDDGTIRHDGRLPGFLHVVDEPVSDEDVYPHPRTTMQPGWEWLTRRDLRLRLLGPVVPLAAELLSDADVTDLRTRASQACATGAEERY